MIRIGTRSSPLALTQAMIVRDVLIPLYPKRKIDIIPFTTRGDQTNKSLHDIGGKSLFTKELQDALLSKEITCAVHSLKDVELHDLPLVLGAFLKREAAHDVLIIRKGVYDEKSPAIMNGPVAGTFTQPLLSGILGTCSPRRCAQTKIAFPNVTTVDLRGNVGTRLKLVNEGVVDATILAAAGLMRLGFNSETFEKEFPGLHQQCHSVSS